MAEVKRFEFAIPNGNKFYIRRYEPFLALEILGTVQKGFLQPIVTFIESQDKSMGDEARMQNLSAALDHLSKSLDGKSLVELAKQVLRPDYVSVVIEGDPPERCEENVLNKAVDDVSDIVSLVIEVLKVNYTKLFTRGRTLIGQAQESMAIH